MLHLMCCGNQIYPVIQALRWELELKPTHFHSIIPSSMMFKQAKVFFSIISTDLLSGLRLYRSIDILIKVKT